MKETSELRLNILLRGLLHFATCIITQLCFDYASKSGVNQGVIGGFLSANMFYTVILFYFKYNEKIKLITFFGILGLVAGVFCVSYTKGDTSGKINQKNLILAIIFSQVTAFFFSLNTFVTKVGMKYIEFASPMRQIVDYFFISASM